LRLMPNTRRITQLRDGDRDTLDRLIRSRTTPLRVVERAKIVLASANGLSGEEICDKVGVSPPTVSRWLNRYDKGGIPAIQRDLPRSGRPKRLDPDLVEAEIVR
jgi:transposase